MKKIFISHRSLDSIMVDELIQYLENIGINKDEIMYTSADSCGAQYDLGTEIKEALNQAEVFIVILSPNYYNSIYCCNELGYIWATGKKTIIYGLPGIDSDKDYKGFVNHGWIIRRLNNPRHIDFLFDELQSYSKKEFTSALKANEYKDAYISRINMVLEKYSLNKKLTDKEKYSPEKIIDIDSLIQNNYYTDKELLLFSYLHDSNNYIWGIAENIQKDIVCWEKANRLKPFLSQDLERFFVMLTKKHYLSVEVVTRKEVYAQSYVGKKDGYSKTMLAAFGADEEGNTKHNYFTIDERLFRAITNVNEKSMEIIKKACNKYKLKWYQRYPKQKND